MMTDEVHLKATGRRMFSRAADPKLRRSAYSVLTYLAIFAPPAVMAVIIHHFTVNVPNGDEWDTAFLVLADRRGTLNFYKLWTQHNEHRMLVANIISVLTARVTDYNVVANVYCGFAFEVLALLLVWRILKLTLRGADSILIPPLVIYSSLLMFWAVAIENWFWGISGLEFLSSVFWAVVVIWALAEWPGRWLGLAIAFIAAVAAICTCAAGFPLLPVIGAALLLNLKNRKKATLIQLGVFVLLSAAFVKFFFWGWSPMFSFSAGQPLWKSVVQAIGYAFIYIGSPFRTRFYWQASMVMGVAGLAWFLYLAARTLIRRSEFDAEITPWLLLGLYAILNAALTAYGRRSQGVGQAASTRYMSIAETFWIAIGVMSALQARRWTMLPDRRKLVHAASGILVALFLVAYGVSYYKAIATLRSINQVLRAGVHAVLCYRTATNADLRPLHPVPQLVRDMSRELEAEHIGPFADGQALVEDSQ